MMDWQTLLTRRRLGESGTSNQAPARSDFQRDYDRIIFSDAFRRLHDKTQVFPLPEDDHIHSRLTHSLEVACVGRSIGNLVGSEIMKKRPELREHGIAESLFGDVVAAACLAHDIGNPPFGHSGEDSMAAWFSRNTAITESLGSDLDHRAELTSFEGNAQGFRILVRHQRPGAGGMRLTCATLATFMKYPRSARASLTDEQKRFRCKKHGFFRSETQYFEEVAQATGLIQRSSEWWCRHPLAYLVEAADDICYRILDLEDGYRLGYVPLDEVEALFVSIAATRAEFDKDAYADQRRRDPREYVSTLRSNAINALIYQTKAIFLEREEELLAGEPIEPLIDLCPSKPALKQLKDVAYDTCYTAKEVLDIELAGYEVIGGLLDTLVPAIFESTGLTRKIRKSFSTAFSEEDPDLYAKLLRITDFISGMTDSYALTLYRRVKGIEIPRGRFLR